MPIVLKSGSLNFLEPLGPVKAFHGIVFYYTMKVHSVPQNVMEIERSASRSDRCTSEEEDVVPFRHKAV